MINIAIIGCGVVMDRYVEIFSQNFTEDVSIVAVCDINNDLSIKRAKELSAKSYNNIDKMFNEENIDLTIILTSSGLHYKHTKIALEHGSHTLTEKPISLRIDHALELIEISKRNNLMAGVAYQNRYNPSIKYLANEISKGSFGKRVLSTIRLRWCRYPDYYKNNWHGTWEMDGGVISQQAIHHIDILQYLGGDIKSISATFTQRLNKLEADDTTVAIVEFEDGSLGAIEATTASRPIDYEASFSIIAEKGMAEIGGIALNKILKWNLIDSKTESEIIIQENSEEIENGFGKGHLPLIEEIIDRLNNNIIEAPITISEGLKSLAIVHAIYRSAETRSWVDLNDLQQSNLFGVKN